MINSVIAAANSLSILISPGVNERLSVTISLVLTVSVGGKLISIDLDSLPPVTMPTLVVTLAVNGGCVSGIKTDIL